MSEIIVRNQKILDFYKRNPSLNFEQINLIKLILPPREPSLILPFRSLEDIKTKKLISTLCALPLKKWQEPSKPHVCLPVEKHRGRNWQPKQPE